MARPHVERAHAPELTPERLAGWPDGTTVRVLSRDPETGAITAVVRLPAGAVREPAGLAAECDTYLLSGRLRVGARDRGAGYYEYAPAGSRHDRWVALEDCELFLMARDGPPDLRPADARAPSHLAVDTDALDWVITPIPGMPGGIFLKVMRTVPATGESVFLMGLVPRWSLDQLEFHDMDEECFIVDGDVWIGNCGRLGAGSYFCRPPTRRTARFSRATALSRCSGRARTSSTTSRTTRCPRASRTAARRRPSRRRWTT